MQEVLLFCVKCWLDAECRRVTLTRWSEMTVFEIVTSLQVLRRA